MTDDLYPRFAIAMQAQRDWQPPPMQFGFRHLWIMISNLQLALRHPGNIGEVGQTAREICDTLIAALPSEELRAFARMGYDTRYDT